MARRRISRRGFLAGSLGAGALLYTRGLWVPRRAQATPALHPGGTTLEATIVPMGPPGSYRTLGWGPGWPTITRVDLVGSTAMASGERRAVASFVHLTDIHLIDTQSPGRVEFLDLLGDPFTAAARPQELLTTQVASSMVERINSLGAGPITGRPFDCAVSTGDNIDNQQWNELQWFLTVLDGGTLLPNSGDPSGYEGIQDGVVVDPTYWHPDPGIDDDFKSLHGFPDMPGLLDASIVGFDTPALSCPWYSTYGNHDGLIQGTLAVSDPIDDILVSSKKIVALQPGQQPIDFLVAMYGSAATVRDELFAGSYPHRDVTSDATRITVKTREWVQAHLDSPATPGPRGHGYTSDHLELPALYYDFDVAPGVVGISLDTGGYNSGSIGEGQLVWLEQQLQAVHSRWYDPFGNEVRGGSVDRLCIVFSHFNPRSMNQPMTDPARPDERRVQGDEVVALLHRYPNVIAWVNGHHHVNAVTPMPDPAGLTGGFWDINTASHVDYPEHARIVEVVDNADGTLSIFCTMIEHAAPPEADLDDTSVLGLAAISRELSANDPQSDLPSRLGTPYDLNVELVLVAPFDLTALPTAGQPASRSAAQATPSFTG